MHDAVMAVADDLKFNVVRVSDELFEIDLVIPKGFLGLVTRTMEGRFKTGLVVRAAHSTSATAGGRLDHHRVTNFLGDLHCLFFCLDDSIAPRRHWHAGFACACARSVLI